MKKETVANLLAVVADEGGSGCEKVETLHEWVAGGMQSQRASEVESHVAQCPRCAAEARLAGWFEQTEESPELETLVAALSGTARPQQAAEVAGMQTSPRWWARPWVSGTLAVAATLAVVAGLSMSPQPPPVGDLPAADVARGATVSIAEPRGVLTSAPDSVGWHGDASARYRVELLAVDGTVLWSAEIDGERVELPSEVREALVERVTYRLRVTALTPDSTAAGTGDEVEFRITTGDRS